MAVWMDGYFWMFLGFPLKKTAISRWIVIMMMLSHIMKVKMSSFVDSFVMKKELRKIPRDSEVRIPKMQMELTRNI